jgi:hypothetical protein
MSEDEARLRERADVVAYMRQQDPDDYWKPEWVARAIAAGKHVGASDAQNRPRTEGT